MAADYTIIQKDEDDSMYVYRAKKNDFETWIKNGDFNDYKLIEEKDLAEECNLSHYEAPFIIILDGYKHVPLKKKEQTVTLIKYEI